MDSLKIELTENELLWLICCISAMHIITAPEGDDTLSPVNDNITLKLMTANRENQNIPDGFGPVPDNIDELTAEAVKNYTGEVLEKIVEKLTHVENDDNIKEE